MALNQYCGLGEVRAALGASPIELPDAVLNLPVYELGLVRELAKISASLPAAFLAVAAVPEDQRGAEQVALFSSAKLFNVYACAKHVGVSLPTMLPKDVGDGKATLSRFADAPYKVTLEAVQLMYDQLKPELEAAFYELTGATPVASAVNSAAGMFIASKRGYDPVTGT